jgi:hypothetical protein
LCPCGSNPAVNEEPAHLTLSLSLRDSEKANLTTKRVRSAVFGELLPDPIDHANMHGSRAVSAASALRLLPALSVVAGTTTAPGPSTNLACLDYCDPQSASEMGPMLSKKVFLAARRITRRRPQSFVRVRQTLAEGGGRQTPSFARFGEQLNFRLFRQHRSK